MVLTRVYIFVLDVPNQETFVIGFSMVLLYGRARVPNLAVFVQSLISLMNIAQERIIKIIENIDSILTVLHGPADIGFTI